MIYLLQLIGKITAVLLFVFGAYQLLYIPIALFIRKKAAEAKETNSYAVLICARNEEAVIPDLISSIKSQTYNQELIKIFVMADNCTDETASVCRALGAVVYERQNTEKIGKGYALEALLDGISADYPDGFDGYFVFDADNVLDKAYISEMNKVFCSGYDIVTGYRNSKNYGDNMISAGYALSFLREGRFLNYPRYVVGSGCTIGGTGFMFSREILEEQGGWKFHLLTEDIEFSAYHIINGRKIGFAQDAVFYDEQPVTFKQSWDQRLRWVKGYMQVLRKYGLKLLCGVFKGEFACFDMLSSLTPIFILSAVGLLTNAINALLMLLSGEPAVLAAAVLAEPLILAYGTMFIIGFITVISEWNRIHTSASKKTIYSLTFPIFLLSYLPIAIVALFSKKVSWKPIVHKGSCTSLPARLKKRLE